MLKRFRRLRLRGRWVRVHLNEGHPTVEGMFLGERGGYVFIDTPSVLPNEGGKRDLGGEIAVPSRRVVYVQPMPS